MRVNTRHYRTIWLEGDGHSVSVIDQRRLPFEFVVRELETVTDAAQAIQNMTVRGAGLIGATAGFGMYLAAIEAESLPEAKRFNFLQAAADELIQTRPTAINLAWAVRRQLDSLSESMSSHPEQLISTTRRTAQAIADEDAEACRQIGMHGVGLIRAISEAKGGKQVNILTHCNAGWLAFVDYGSATAPIYQAFEEGVPVHVWVDETRPRNQGARLTAWELGQHGVPHTVIVDNVGGHLMQHGKVDLVITGTDRTTHTGDVANKIGTYLKALAANDNGIPFYVGLPSSTFDWEHADGVNDIPIEQRDAGEVRTLSGLLPDGKIAEIDILPPESPAVNYAFDVTPARLVTGLITERGVCRATAEGIAELFPERTAGARGEE
jgi:methylthioribose-1-phosphate isomerase